MLTEHKFSGFTKMLVSGQNKIIKYWLLKCIKCINSVTIRSST